MYKINSNDFKILIKYKHFLFELDNLLENIPRRDYYFKDKVRDIAYELLEVILRCNNDIDSNSDKYLVIMKGHIATLDFMFDRLYSKRYISESQLYNIGQKLIEINKMVSGWLKDGS